jgi:hypothetical protein
MDKKDSHSENNDAVNSVVMSKSAPQPVKWSQENELIMVEWCDIAQCYKWLHTKCHHKLSARHAWFTIPAIALSTISGTASFAQTSLPLDTQVYAPMVIGSINILIGISTTIQQYLKISELNEAHRVSGISWDKFARNIRIELAKDPDERMDAGQFLKICRAEFDRLMETSPSIDEKTVIDFKKAFQGDDSAERRKQFEDIQKRRFDELRKPDICDIIIPANESRHHWYKDVNRVRRNTFSEDFFSRESIYEKFNEYSDFSKSGKNDIEENFHRSNNEHADNNEKHKDNEKEKEEKKHAEEKMKIHMEYISAYVRKFNDSVGRNPHDIEIIENLKDNLDMDILNEFLKDYNPHDDAV